MLKTISAALLSVSLIAAPALAAGQAKTAPAPVTKSEQVKPAKSNALKANAKMGGHHVRHVRHQRHEKHAGALKKHHVSKMTIRHSGPTIKRG
jgi:hypothetical protein